jgi:hypothetical protein
MMLQTNKSKELIPSLFEMTTSEENFIRDIAEKTEVPISVNAQNLLRLVFDEQQPRYALEIPNSSNRLAAPHAEREIAEIVDIEFSALEKPNQFHFNVYPNPFEGNFTIELVGVDNATITIRDVSGKLIKQQIINTDKQVVSTETLSGGLYFVELRNDEGLLDVKRIVKQ